MTSPTQPLSAPSPADLPTTAMTPEEAEAATADMTDVLGPLTHEEGPAIEVLDAASDEDRSAGTPTAQLSPEEGWSAPSADENLTPLDPLAAIRSVRPWPGARSADEPDRAAEEAASSAVPAGAPNEALRGPHAVWSGSTLTREPDDNQVQRRSAVRPGTLMWGLVLLTIGIVILSMSLGARIDFVTAAVVLLAAAGVSLLLIAVLPRRRSTR